MTDWRWNISGQNKEVIEINSEIFPSDGSLNCSGTDTKEAKYWDAKCFKSYVTGCLYRKELLYVSMSYSLLSFKLMEKENTHAQIWLWIFPLVIQALSGTSYIILDLSHIPVWMSALPSKKSPEKEAEITSVETNCFLHKVVNNSTLEADIASNKLRCFQ